MIVAIILVSVAACALAAVASFVITRASNRSALSNMVLGGVLALAVLAGAIFIAFFMARAMYSH